MIELATSGVLINGAHHFQGAFYVRLLHRKKASNSSEFRNDSYLYET